MMYKTTLFKTFKKAALIMLFCTFFTKVWCQGIHNKAQFKDKDIYTNFDEVEEKPEFQDGISELYKFIGANFKVSDEAKKNKIKGKAYVQFVIEKDGSLSGFKVLKDPGFGIGEEAIRVLKLSPKWVAGAVGGNPVRVMYDLPITVHSKM